MGDRANVMVVQDWGNTDPVYLYSHWGGSVLPLDVQKALARRVRWGDGSYLTRIIFDQMTDGVQGEETGFGIATYRPDNEYPIIKVDPKARTVSFHAEGSEQNHEDNPIASWTFEKYVGLSEFEIEKKWRE